MKRALVSPVGAVKRAIHRAGEWYCRGVTRREFLAQPRFPRNERPIEYAFVFRHLIAAPGDRVLDVGTGETALPHLIETSGFRVTAIDNVDDYAPAGSFNRHFYVMRDDVRHPRLRETFDFITCVSTVEHIPEHEDAVRSMFGLLNPGGLLILTVPYNESRYVSNIYDLPQAGYGKDVPYVCQVFSRRNVRRWQEANGARVLEQEYWRCFEGEFWTFGGRLDPPERVGVEARHQLSCLAFRKG